MVGSAPRNSDIGGLGCRHSIQAFRSCSGRSGPSRGRGARTGLTILMTMTNWSEYEDQWQVHTRSRYSPFPEGRTAPRPAPHRPAVQSPNSKTGTWAESGHRTGLKTELKRPRKHGGWTGSTESVWGSPVSSAVAARVRGHAGSQGGGLGPRSLSSGPGSVNPQAVPEKPDGLQLSRGWRLCPGTVTAGAHRPEAQPGGDRTPEQKATHRRGRWCNSKSPQHIIHNSPNNSHP